MRRFSYWGNCCGCSALSIYMPSRSNHKRNTEDIRQLDNDNVFHDLSTFSIPLANHSLCYHTKPSLDRPSGALQVLISSLSTSIEGKM
mmetsp:Transcript_17131/g.26740  ORF Transcript_17131/g.26740 Transcript_17131/m.26740 type:complete len:88 (-) Transcript_17131:503-766(-)